MIKLVHRQKTGQNLENSSVTEMLVNRQNGSKVKQVDQVDQL